jgi:hypothetical protein
MVVSTESIGLRPTDVPIIRRCYDAAEPFRGSLSPRL